MPFTIQWAISQLFSYQPYLWGIFVGIAVGTAYLGQWRGIMAGHFIIALLVGYLDIAYQNLHRSEMDMDIVFDEGVLGRILLINSVLLPMSAIGLFLAFRRRKQVKSAV